MVGNGTIEWVEGPCQIEDAFWPKIADKVYDTQIGQETVSLGEDLIVWGEAGRIRERSAEVVICYSERDVEVYQVGDELI